ncbi:MAG TPA: UPF0280 family protein [Patescibacteria group bacterium]|nr:UPF0280 family protein [Patescibacteria group bacterium]
MKTSAPQKRFYRGLIHHKDIHSRTIAVSETDLQIGTDRPVDVRFVEARIRQYRRQIQAYIIKDRKFLHSLKPIAVELTAPPIIKQMARAGSLAGVGPMASVAGAIAQFLGRDLLRKGYKDVIIENGGDIFIKSRRTRLVGIYAGKHQLWNKIAIAIKPRQTPLGVCTSSGRLGHSVSFGDADGVVILAKNASVADAAATAVANTVNSSSDLPQAIARGRLIRGVRGIVVIFRENLAVWGDVKLQNSPLRF